MIVYSFLPYFCPGLFSPGLYGAPVRALPVPCTSGAHPCTEQCKTLKLPPLLWWYPQNHTSEHTKGWSRLHPSHPSSHLFILLFKNISFSHTLLLFLPFSHLFLPSQRQTLMFHPPWLSLCPSGCYPRDNHPLLISSSFLELQFLSRAVANRFTPIHPNQIKWMCSYFCS